uniref:Preprotein translocase subunit Y n=1 Tax=Nitzschia sp. IriIs04 TaxID=1444690 RepID=A0A0S3QPN3_9STRA|nr:preprotein translocase subunit Y [Nitzschia sp. IriIs04]BAT70295.1 preprotein translocase subunit Y [Nitzschia sp. IriIs04]
MIKIIINIIKFFKKIFLVDFEIIKNFSLGLEAYLISYQIILLYSSILKDKNKNKNISNHCLKKKVYSLTLVFIIINSIFKYLFLKKLNYNITYFKLIYITICLILGTFLLIWLGNIINNFNFINGHLLLNSIEYIFKFIYNLNIILLKNESFKRFTIIKLVFFFQFIAFFINIFILTFFKKIYLITVNSSKKQTKNFYLSLDIKSKNFYLINFLINFMEIKLFFNFKKNYILLNFFSFYSLIVIINFFSITLNYNLKNIIINFQKNNINLLNINSILNYKIIYFSYHLYYLNLIISFLLAFLVFLPFYLEKFLNIVFFNKLNLIYLLQIANLFFEILKKIKINNTIQNKKYKTL